MIANSIAFHLIFLSSVAQRNIENALETSGNLVSQKCGHFEFKIYIKTIYNLFWEIFKLRDFKEIYVEECGRDHKNIHQLNKHFTSYPCNQNQLSG